MRPQVREAKQDVFIEDKVNGVRVNPMDAMQLFETKLVMDHLCLYW